ncbi:conserved hypothetical protein; putative phage-related protein [Acinetobacter baumannii SDF]|uniref:DUF7666 domain-containing protein n=1 Tax=Acinetobacter baumannii (strain SDF) TaxID=509170 RepID=B0VTJ6_ACIBS|nr:conserved hypothetical protein; putative phage-related protein [Acinetobacter baumannii SDF]
MITTQKKETITSYKGFDKNLQCRGFQYEIGKTFEHKGKVKACGSGFHACEYPLDVFGYYAPGELNRFAVVEQSGDLSRGDDDTKVASKSITIKAEVDIPVLVKAAIEYTTSRCEPIKEDSPAFTDNNCGQAIATGDKSASSATGNWAASLTTGHYSESQIKDQEDDQYGVAISTGYEGKAKASEGSAIVLTHRNSDGEILHIRASKVGENGVKADTWYQLDANGQFVEA